MRKIKARRDEWDLWVNFWRWTCTWSGLMQWSKVSLLKTITHVLTTGDWSEWVQPLVSCVVPSFPIWHGGWTFRRSRIVFATLPILAVQISTSCVCLVKFMKVPHPQKNCSNDSILNTSTLRTLSFYWRLSQTTAASDVRDYFETM